MEKSKQQTPFVNIGSSMLLVIFLVLCLVTFATLSLSSAQSDASFSERMAARRTEYYQASNKAEAILALIDETLQQGGQEFISPDTAISYNKKENRISYQIPINDKQALSVVLDIAPDDTAGRLYRILEWKTTNTQDWSSEQPLNLMPIDLIGK